MVNLQFYLCSGMLLKLNWSLMTFLLYIYIYIIHLLDRAETNIIFIWSGKVILGEGKPCVHLVHHTLY